MSTENSDITTVRTSTKIVLTLALAVLLMILVAALAPARPIVASISNQTPFLYLQGISGSFWQGKAQLAAVQIYNKWLSLGQFSWSISLPSLLLLKPELSIDSRQSRQIFTARLQLHPDRSVHLYDLLLEGDTAMINHWLSSPRLRVGGNVLLSARHLSWNRGVRDLDASAIWEQAWILYAGQKIPLGSFSGEILHDDEGRISIDLSSPPEGTLECSGSIRYDGSIVYIDLNLQPRQSAPAELFDFLLTLAGEPDENGVYRVVTNIDTVPDKNKPGEP